jgi:2'-5' RNA ligase
MGLGAGDTMIRAFLAAELDEALKGRLADVQQTLKRELGHDLTKEVRFSWVQPASMHLTVKFLGDTEESVIDALREAVAPLAAQYLPLHIPLERLGVFPRPQQPRVVWIGPGHTWETGEEAERLQSLHRAVEACCDSFGFAPEARPLSPHLTVARIKEGERQAGQALARSGVLDHLQPVGTLTMGSIVMMQSDLRPSGPLYTKLWDSRPAR